MNLRAFAGALAIALALQSCGEEAGAEIVDPQVASREAPLAVLDRCFVDPHDEGYHGHEVFTGDVALVLSAPILSQGELQQDLSDQLMAQSSEHGFKVVFLQDMSQAMLESVTLSIMRDRWEQETDPLLLVDGEGEVRKAFGLGERTTVVVALRDRVVLEQFDGEAAKGDPSIVPAAFAR